MIYNISTPTFRKVFALPCAADSFLKTADGDFYKVLITVYGSDSDIADTADIALRCGISEQKANDALLFWDSNGLLSLDGKQKDRPKAVAASASMEHSEQKPAQQTASKAVVKYSPSELAKKGKDVPEIGMLFEEIQKIFGRTINAHETAALITIYEYYGFSVSTILIMAQYCRDNGKERISYLEKLAKSWFEEGIIDYHQAEAEIIRLTDENDFDKRAARSLNIRDGLTERQRKFINDWRNWGFTIDMISLAGERSRDRLNKVDMRYINGIMENWRKSGIFTPRDAEQQDIEFKENKQKNKNNGSDAPSYDIKAWQDMAASIDPNEIGFKGGDDD